MSTNSSSLGSEIYNDTADFGKLWVLISAIIGSIIAIVMIIIGIYILASKNNNTKISATITKINNDATGICDTKDLNCTITVSYIYNNIEQTKNISKPNSVQVYKVGDTIDVYVNNNGSVSGDQNTPPKIMGGVLIIIALIILASSWFWYWASKKYKVVAAAQGIGGVLNIATGGRL